MADLACRALVLTVHPTYLGMQIEHWQLQVMDTQWSALCFPLTLDYLQ